ncbi:hypothetical protein ABZ372_40780, partial [Streptomyces sp. NPDC005921]
MRPLAPTAVGWSLGFLNQALLPWNQIAVHSPLRSATAKTWPVETREPRSLTSSVESSPSGLRPGSWISGAFSSGSVCRRTALEPCGLHFLPSPSHPVYRGWKRAKARERAAELLDLVGLDPGTYGRRY